MRYTTLISTFVLALNASVGVLADQSPATTIINSFTTRAEIGSLTLSGAAGWDASGHNFEIDVNNPGAQTVSFAIQLDDTARHREIENFTIEPGQTKTFSMPFDDPRAYMMGALPAEPGAQRASFNLNRQMDPTHIAKWQVFIRSVPPGSPITLILERARFAPAIPMHDIVDRYGQYTGYEWPGKIHSDTDLTNQRDAERRDLAAHPGMPQRDIYGGTMHGALRPSIGSNRRDSI